MLALLNVITYEIYFRFKKLVLRTNPPVCFEHPVEKLGFIEHYYYYSILIRRHENLLHVQESQISHIKFLPFLCSSTVYQWGPWIGYVCLCVSVCATCPHIAEDVLLPSSSDALQEKYQKCHQVGPYPSSG